MPIAPIQNAIVDRPTISFKAESEKPSVLLIDARATRSAIDRVRDALTSSRSLSRLESVARPRMPVSMRIEGGGERRRSIVRPPLRQEARRAQTATATILIGHACVPQVVGTTPITNGGRRGRDAWRRRQFSESAVDAVEPWLLVPHWSVLLAPENDSRRPGNVPSRSTVCPAC